jgi:hypothetical protein
MPKPEHHTVEKQTIHGTPVTVTTHCLDKQWHCPVANVDPGANIARTDGESREQVVSTALDKATKRLGGK